MTQVRGLAQHESRPFHTANPLTRTITKWETACWKTCWSTAADQSSGVVPPEPCAGTSSSGLQALRGCETHMPFCSRRAPPSIPDQPHIVRALQEPTDGGRARITRLRDKGAQYKL